MNTLKKIIQPELLLNAKIAQTNILEMKFKADKSKIIFRPHFKTHQSIEIGQWFRKAGVEKITVSSLRMAEYFSQDNWKDITVAFPVNLREIKLINDLAQKIKLNLLVESMDSVRFLSKHLKHKVYLYLKLDVGANRTGLKINDKIQIDRITQEISKSNKMIFEGLLTHSGHTYSAKRKSEILDIYYSSVEKMNQIRNSVSKDLIISYGDTPSCSVVKKFDGIDEIRPGNFVFYDYMQYKLGVCPANKIGCVLAAPIVAKHKERNELIVYAGAVHLSKDFIIGNNEKIFGGVVEIKKAGWGKLLSDCSVKSISQEHGVVKVNKKYFEEFEIGSLIGIVPVHSCLTAHLMKHYLTTDGKRIDMFAV